MPGAEKKSSRASQPRLATESIAGRRPYQEDALLTRTFPDGRTLLAVADGMGGHAAGEVASAIALETLREAVEGKQDLRSAFHLANGRIHARAAEPGKQGMGTTLVALLLEGERFAVANVGDSRCYLLSEGRIRRLTEDHSFVAEAVRRGQSEAEAMTSQWKDALTRSMGTGADVEVDIFGPFPVTPDTALLLCSDGLYKTLTDEDLLGLYLQSSGPEAAAHTLVSQALDRGSDDNITLVIAEFGEVPRGGQAGTMPIEFEPPPHAAGEPDETTSEGTSGGSDPEGAAPPGNRPPSSPQDDAARPEDDFARSKDDSARREEGAAGEPRESSGHGGGRDDEPVTGDGPRREVLIAAAVALFLLVLVLAYIVR